jgi:hypothetical protein
MYLGHRTYSEPKGLGDNSMCGKQGPVEGTEAGALQGPRAMVRAILPKSCATSPIARILLTEEGGTEEKTSGSPNSLEGESPKGQ